MRKLVAALACRNQGSRLYGKPSPSWITLFPACPVLTVLIQSYWAFQMEMQTVILSTMRK